MDAYFLGEWCPDSQQIGFSDVDVLRLDLSDCGLHELPSSIMRLTNLTALDLRDNDLSVLPVELGLLTALESIALDVRPCLGSPPTLLNDNELFCYYPRDELDNAKK
jgi:hypothetical protein